MCNKHFCTQLPFYYSNNQGRSRRSNWSGFGWTTISQVKTNFILQKSSNKQKYQHDFWTCIAYNTVDRKSIIMMKWKIIGWPCTQNISCRTKYSVVQRLSNKQSAKVICKFDRLRTSYSKRQKSHMSIDKLMCAHTINYIALFNHGLTSCKDLATALVTVLC